MRRGTGVAMTSSFRGWARSEGDFVPLDTYRPMIELLASTLDVRTNSAVVAIEAGDGAISTVRLDGEASPVHARHVVVTVPLAVLRRHQIEFVPPLPPGKLDAIDGIGYVCVYARAVAPLLCSRRAIVVVSTGSRKLPSCLRDLQRLSGRRIVRAWCARATVRILRCGSSRVVIF